MEFIDPRFLLTHQDWLCRDLGKYLMAIPLPIRFVSGDNTFKIFHLDKSRYSFIYFDPVLHYCSYWYNADPFQEWGVKDDGPLYLIESLEKFIDIIKHHLIQNHVESHMLITMKTTGQP